MSASGAATTSAKKLSPEENEAMVQFIYDTLSRGNAAKKSLDSATMLADMYMQNDYIASQEKAYMRQPKVAKLKYRGKAWYRESDNATNFAIDKYHKRQEQIDKAVRSVIAKERAKYPK